MSRDNDLLINSHFVDHNTIEQHRELVKTKGLKSLGVEATSTTLKTTITAIRLLSYFTVIFALPVHIIASLYYKSVGKKIVEEDNVALIRNQCLFVPTQKEREYLRRSGLLEKGEFLEETPKTFQGIFEAHQVYDFARAFASENSSNKLKDYLGQSQISKESLNEVAELSSKIANNKLSYGKIPTWFKQLSAMNKTMNIAIAHKNDESAIYELLHQLTDYGREVTDLGNIKSELFGLVANAYKKMREQGTEVDQAKTAITLLVPLLLHLSNEGRSDVATAFANAFVEHSYLRNEISENQDEFIIQFNKNIKNRLKKLHSPEKVKKAINTFQAEFNHPEHLDSVLNDQFGEGNAELARRVLQEMDPRVIDGSVAFSQSVLAEKSYTKQVRLLVPEIAKELDLAEGVVIRALITDDLTPENIEEKKNVLKKLKPLFEATGNTALIQGCFVYSPQGFIGNVDDKDYWSDWNKAVAYAQRKFPADKYTDEFVARAFSSAVQTLTERNGNNHRVAIEQLGHACDTYAFFNRDRREKIRKKIQTELELYTLQEKLKHVGTGEVAQTVAEEYNLAIDIIQPYLRSPLDIDFVKQLRNLKIIAEHLPVLQRAIEKQQLIDAFAKSYDPDLLAKFLSNDQQQDKIIKILSYGKDLAKKKIYTSEVIGQALSQTLSQLVNEKHISPEKALESLYKAAKSIRDNDQDKYIKCLLQQKLLQIEILERVKEQATSKGYNVNRGTRGLCKLLLDSFVVHKELPKRATVDYVADAVTKTLDLHFTKKAKETAIALSFASNLLLEKKLSKLDKMGLPVFSDAIMQIIKDKAIGRDKMEESLNIDQEKLLFPIIIELLPVFCKSFIPEEREDIHQNMQVILDKVRQRFDKSKTFKVEQAQAYEHIGMVYTWLNLGPEMLSPFISTGLNLVTEELKKAQRSLNQMEGESIDSQAIEDMFASSESSAAMQTFLPLAASLISGVHEKHREIQEIRRHDVEPLIVTEGSDEEQRVDDYTDVVVLKPFEAILFDLFDKIPNSESTLLKLVDKAPSLIQAGGGIGNWFARKVGSSLIKKHLNESLGMDEHHIKFMNDSAEDFLSIGLILVPFLMERHNLRSYLGIIHDIKAMAISEEPINQKELNLKLLELLEAIMEDVEEYKPTILQSIAHIHQKINQ